MERGGGFESFIERPDNPHAILAGNVAYPTSLFNTVVFVFPLKYQAFNHAMIDYPDGSHVKLWDLEEDTIDQLHEKGYTFVHSPWPSESQEEEFFRCERAYLEIELGRLSVENPPDSVD